MGTHLKDLVRFRKDRLFEGAVNIGWFSSDDARTSAAARSFVFHGPRYHGIGQDEVGTEHGHKLVDTATFARTLIRQCYGLDDQPFTLAIAGYGSGKSHLALTLATLLSNPDGDEASAALKSIEAADQEIGAEIEALLAEQTQPCLVIALNGMQSFNLTAEVARQIGRELKRRDIGTQPLEELRPRFQQASKFITISSEAIVRDLLAACEVADVADVLAGLGDHDEAVYTKVHEFFAARGMTIQTLSGESIGDIIGLTTREYCGDGKPFHSLVVLFDEFGRYLEFATQRSEIAGSGALQDLFEAVQENAGSALFAGFIQFELNAYVERIAPTHRNEITRYVTRYQGARRFYLSINLETLIANLIEKRPESDLENRLSSSLSREDSALLQSDLARWFPRAQNHRLWNDRDQFHRVVRLGCWPLSPFSTWFLFSLASAGKDLQQRSVLSFLGDAIESHAGKLVPGDLNWSLAPVDLWSEALQHELVTTEEAGNRGSMARLLDSVVARHPTQLSGSPFRVLCAVVIASKLDLQARDKPDAVKALSYLAGLELRETESTARLLDDEYNILDWNEAFRTFEIRGEGVPRREFVERIKELAASYDDSARAQLFSSNILDLCPSLANLDCTFGQQYSISTREWQYEVAASDLDMLPMQIELATTRWRDSVGVDEPKGTAIYCYVPPQVSAESVSGGVRKQLRDAAKRFSLDALPILVMLVNDASASIGQGLAELDVLEDGISDEERQAFGNLIPGHREKLLRVLGSRIEDSVAELIVCTGLKREIDVRSPAEAGNALFKGIYSIPIPFPFDGFSSTRGNAAETCFELTRELLMGRLDYDAVIAKPAKTKNRAIEVLKKAWGVFSSTGEVKKHPQCEALSSLSERWDELLASSDSELLVSAMFDQACRPPYGANLASAGLFFGVYVAARLQGLIVVRGSKQLSVQQWMQDGLFKGKFVDQKLISGVSLIRAGEISSEWESLLDEWESVSTHLGKVSCLRRADDLKKRIQPSPSVVSRYRLLDEQAARSARALVEMENSNDDALKKVEKGLERRDIRDLSWGADILVQNTRKMEEETPAWTEAQMLEMGPHVERARQAIILHFDHWQQGQKPTRNTPEGVGDFMHRMKKIAANLDNIGLGKHAERLLGYARTRVDYFELLATAEQLIRDVESWLTANSHADENPAIALIRQIKHTGEGYTEELKNIFEKTKLSRLNESRTAVATFLRKLQETEQAIQARAAALWNTTISNREDLDRLLAETQILEKHFQGIPVDLEDLLCMKRGLQQYGVDYARLSSEDLSWQDFESLVNDLRNRTAQEVAGDDIPWQPDQVIGSFAEYIAARRIEMSETWIGSLEDKASNIASMSMMEARALHEHGLRIPAILTDDHRRGVEEVLNKVEDHLGTLKIDWLVQEFSELAPEGRRRFMDRIRDMV